MECLDRKGTGTIYESYTMLTINGDRHPLMNRMHEPDSKLPPDKQDKRSVIALERDDVDTWLHGTLDEARFLARAPQVEIIDAAPVTNS